MINLKNAKILVVDDIIDNIKVILPFLKKAEYKVAYALNGLEAIKIVKKNKFDLILLDVNMPLMNGYEACKILKTLDNCKDVPILFLTAKKDVDSIVDGFKVGAVDYITKPFFGDELLARVKTHLELKFAKSNLMQTNILLNEEKNKSDKLLLSLLPKNIADELKQNGKVIPKTYDNVVLFYSDIVNFTAQCKKINPITIIEELNEIFGTFDTIFKKNHCERIKTVGDAYIAGAGIFETDSDSISNMIKAAREIILYLKKWNEMNVDKWQIRLGIHVGSVVGGIIGHDKFIFDLFGTTMNVACRLEEMSEPMKINVSEQIYEKIKNDFTLTKRGKVEVKGIGQVEMYYIEETPEN